MRRGDTACAETRKPGERQLTGPSVVWHRPEKPTPFPLPKEAPDERRSGGATEAEARRRVSPRRLGGDNVPYRGEALGVGNRDIAGENPADHSVALGERRALPRI